MIPSSAYWQKRFTELEEARNKMMREHINRDVVQQFMQSLIQINQEISAWYARYAGEQGVTEAIARERLTQQELEAFKLSLAKYKALSKAYASNPHYKNQDILKILQAASAGRAVRRLESLRARIKAELDILYYGQDKKMREWLSDVYEDAFLKSGYVIEKGFGMGVHLSAPDTRQVSDIMAKPWTSDGQTFSDRIWRDHDKLIQTLSDDLSKACIRGESLQNVVRRVTDRMGVATSSAARLVSTESAFFATAGQNELYKELGVKKYEFVATLDSKTSETCREHDGKVYELSKMKPGTNAPPLHCYCRSVTVPAFDDNADEEMSRAARDPKTGKTVHVPAGMTYPEWERVYVNKAQPAEAWKENYKKRIMQMRRPKNEQEILKQFNYVGEDTYSYAEKMKAVNPNLGTGKEWIKNCQRCVVAQELQYRGYNVTAKPRRDDAIGSSGVAAWRFNSSRWSMDTDVVATRRKTMRADLEKAFAKWGDDARAVIRIQWTKKAGNSEGHFFMCRKEAGELVFEDAQINRRRDLEATLEDCTRLDQKLWFMRVDNRDLSDLVVDAVENVEV